MTVRTSGRGPRTIASSGFSVASGGVRTVRFTVPRRLSAGLARTRRATARFDTAAGRNDKSLRLAKR